MSTQIVNNFHQDSAIFNDKHAVHQFENVTPEASIGLSSNEEDDTTTTPSLSPHQSNEKSSNSSLSSKGSLNYNTTKTSLDTKGFPSSTTSLPPTKSSTPSQFIFKKPSYNKHYHHTHFHHKLEKKETIFKDLKKLFKSDKKKKQKKVSATTSEVSFGNKFNKDLEGKYGKWGKASKIKGGPIIIFLTFLFRPICRKRCRWLCSINKT